MPPPLLYNQKITISKQALTQEVDGEMVILDLESENYFVLDVVGTRIWQLLRENDDLQSVVNVMLAEFDVQADQLETDIEALLTNLDEAGLVSAQSARN